MDSGTEGFRSVVQGLHDMRKLPARSRSYLVRCIIPKYAHDPVTNVLAVQIGLLRATIVPGSANVDTPA